MYHFFRSLPRNFYRSFAVRNIWWHLAAIGLTYLIVVTNLDWQYFLFAQSLSFRYIFFPALIVGGLLPIIAPLFLIIRSWFNKSNRLNHSGWGLGQAALLGSGVSSFYKAFTGRIQPDLFNLTINTSHQFNFGFWKHGIFWGWPSSHTTIAFAMAVYLIYIFPKNKVVKTLCLLYAFYIGIGVITFSIHWLSEFVAGALIGTAIGMVVGQSFRRKTTY